jgi:hypothetical protein
MRPDHSNRFQSFLLTPEEIKTAVQCSPLFFAYLQNKISSYASAALDYVHDPDKPLHVTVAKHEALKAQVEVLEELLRELVPPDDQLSSSQEESGNTSLF